MDEPHLMTLWEVATASRDGIDHSLWDDTAPSDSNALSEVWPTRRGVAFTGEQNGHSYVVMVCLQKEAPSDFTDPDYDDG